MYVIRNGKIVVSEALLDALAFGDARGRPRVAFESVLRGAAFALKTRDVSRIGTPFSPIELARGFVEWAWSKYGPLAAHVLGSEKIYSPNDVGELVVALEEAGALGPVDHDGNLERDVAFFVARTAPDWLGPFGHDCVEQIRQKKDGWVELGRSVTESPGLPTKPRT